MFALTTTENTSSTNNDKNHKVSSWTADPDLPYVASGYVQLVFNMFLVGVALYIGLAFIRTIQRDVDLKVEEYSAGIPSSLFLFHFTFCLQSRNTARNGSVLKRVSGKSLRAKYARPCHGKGVCRVGKMHEQRSHSRRTSSGFGRDFRGNHKLVHRTNQL